MISGKTKKQDSPQKLDKQVRKSFFKYVSFCQKDSRIIEILTRISDMILFLTMAVRIKLYGISIYAMNNYDTNYFINIFVKHLNMTSLRLNYRQCFQVKDKLSVKGALIFIKKTFCH